MFNNVEKMTPEELISELRRWHFTYRDAPNNFDARLIHRAIELIKELTVEKTEQETSRS